MTDAVQSWAPPRSSAAATRFWVNLVFLLTFFPSVLDFVIPSQTQPLAGFAALPLLFMHPIRLNRTTVPALIGVVVVLGYIAGSLLVYPGNEGLIVANGTTYFMGAIVLLAMWDKLDLLNPWVFRWALMVWVVVGCVQEFPFPAAIKDAFVTVLGPFVSDRFIMDTYGAGGGGRGVILLASEPSISSPSVLYFGLTALFLRDRMMIGRRELAWSLAAVIALAAFNRSGTMVILSLLAMVGWCLDLILSQPVRVRIVAAGLMGGALAALFAFATLLPTDIRGILVLRQIVQALWSFDSLHGFYTALLLAGGQRLLVLSYGYGSLIDNYALGHGIASWSIDWVLDRVIRMIGISPADMLAGIGQEGGLQVKPAAYFSVIAFDTGLPGLVPLLWSVASAFSWRSRHFGTPSRRFVYLLPGAGWLLIFIIAGMLSPWMMIAYAISSAKESDPSEVASFGRAT